MPGRAPILVTGADGFVGSHLLAELGEDAVPLDVDVREAAALLAAVRSHAPAVVVHLAAISSVAESWSQNAEIWSVNAIGTVNLVEAIQREAPGARLLLVSTGEVYGRAEQLPTAEDAPVAPLSPYAASKAAAEIACGQAAMAAGLDVVVARSFQHEGPGRDERFAIGSWTRQIARLELSGGGALRVGDLTPERDISDVRDVCRAYRLLLDPDVPAGTYNVASGTKTRLADVAEQLVGMARAPVSIEQDPDRLRPADIPVVWGDSSKLRAATGWAPEIPLERTLADALDYARAVVSRESVAERMTAAKRALDHGHHGPGRLLPRRAPAREGLRGLRDGAPLVDRELRADRAPHRPRSRSSRPTSWTSPRSSRRSRRRGPHEVYNLGAQSFVPTSWRQPVLTAEFTAVGVTRVARGDPAGRPFDPLLPGVLVGDVRQGARGPAERADAVLPALAVWRRQGLRALHHGQLPRVLRAVRGLRDPLQPRVARAAGSSS